jgi:replicative DNA helicase
MTYGDEQDIRVPPHSVQAEQAVLGGLMLDNQTWDVVVSRVGQEDFYRRDHQRIYEGIRHLAGQQMPFDVVTLFETFEKFNWTEEVGGLAYLATLAKETPSAANIVAYADIVREKSVRRQMIAAGAHIAAMGFNAGGNVAFDLEKAESEIFRIAEQRERGRAGWVDMKETLSRALTSIETAHSNGGKITGYSTGLADLDELTNGLNKSDLIILAARPAMGKSSLAMQFAQSVAMNHEIAAVFSMEMPVEQLGVRMLSSMARVDNSFLRTGGMPDDCWPRLISASNILSDIPLFIDDSAGLSPFEIRSRVRRLVRAEKRPIGLVVVDYLQLMEVPGLENDPVQAVTACSRALKGLAKELDCPVVALSQLSRDCEKRPNKRPIPSDLRQSGAIEQDADMIAFIYRDEIYNKDSQDKGVAELIIAKHRNGPIGTVKATFIGQYTRFDNFASPYSDNSAC